MKDPQVEATLHLGKDGVTDAWLEELRGQVKRRRVVKVKLLKSARGERSAKEAARDIAQRARVVLVDVRGGTAVFRKPDRPT